MYSFYFCLKNGVLVEQSDDKKGVTRDIIEFIEKDWTEAKKREKLIRPFISTVCPRAVVVSLYRGMAGIHRVSRTDLYNLFMAIYY